MRAATRDLHAAAERAGVMPALLRGELARDRYVLLLRNLHALYVALERSLARHARHPCVLTLQVPGLERAGALAADLDHLHGDAWPRLPTTQVMQGYCHRLETVAHAVPSRLAAHVYVRYLGDLSGGQLLRDVVRRSLRLAGEEGTAFYTFGSGGSVRRLKDALKSGLDQVPCDAAESDAIVDEARRSFTDHVALFEELARPFQPSTSLPAA